MEISVRGVVVLALALAACRGKESGPESATGSAATGKPAAVAVAEPTGNSCDAHMKRLESALLAVVHDSPGSPPAIPLEVKLPTAAGKPIDGASGIVVVVARDGQFHVPGASYPLVGVREYIDDRYRAALDAAGASKGPAAPWPLYFWADRDLAASSVAPVLAGLPDGWSARLVVAGAPRARSHAEVLARPSVKQLVASLPKYEPQASEVLAQRIRAAITPCDRIVTALSDAILGSGPTNANAAMATKVPRAALACDCKLADLDIFEYWLLLQVGGFSEPVGWVPFPKVAANESRTIAELATGD